MTATEPLLLRINEAAARLAVEPVTLRKWIADKRVAAVRLGRAVRVPVAEVERIIQEGMA